ncbi:beta-galactosidase [uncultured Microbacterium sp.]|uniref:Beta-galactosidase n=1 Tax=uncultured Microbacterium sp. TaxID=191216 RepID=A0A1Y5P0B7_9MICO|nr:beta-galactosidase [uncultured Microbacterium sp.]SBS72117.1 Beta-galactosidase [uncultured Microbacterium sp.]
MTMDGGQTRRWVKDGALGAGRMRYGADYNPEQWPREVWRDDMRLMREAGVNVVSLAIFSWAHLEPRPGEWDFAWLDEIMDLLHEHGIDVDLATATASPPPWLTRLHPEVLPQTVDGTILSPGARQHWRPTSPIFRDYALRLTRVIAERYAQHPALVAWHISNELGCHNLYDFSDDAARAFRIWLQERYATLDALNDAWGTAFWSQRYSEWDEILPPRVAPTQRNPGQQLDFERFSSDAVRDHLRAEAAVLAEISPNVPRTTNFMVAGNVREIDYASWVGDVDFVSNDHYLVPGPAGRDDLSFWANLTGNLAAGRPWFLMEHATSAVNWRSANTPKRPGELIRDALTHVGHGADAVCYFQWRQSRAGGERYHSGMVPHAGPDSRVFRDVVQLGAELDALAPVTGSHREQARVAVLFDYESWWVSGRDSHPSDRIAYDVEVQGWYRALLDLGVRADVLPVGASFDDYEVVVAPMLHIVTDELRARLEDVVRDGRHVVTTYFSGIVDEHDRVWLGGYPGALRDLLGVTVEEFVPLLPGERIALASGATASTWTERITRVDHDVEVLDAYADGDLSGAPAVTRRRVGTGTATYVSADIGRDGAREVLRGLADDVAALRGDVRAARGDLEVIVRIGADARFVFLANRTDEPITVARGGEILSGGEPIGDIAEIPPRGVIVLQTGLEQVGTAPLRETAAVLG